MIRAKEVKIKDCIPLVNGIWTYIDYQFPEVFDIQSSQLDILMISSWSMRNAAPILKVLHNSDDGTTMLTDTELQTLAGIIKGMYKHKWDKMMAVAVEEYDPIHNYYDSLEETIEYSENEDSTKDIDGSNSNTRTDDLQTSTTDSRTKTETRNLNNTGSDSSADNIYGFNSSTAVGDRTSSGTDSNLETGTIGTVDGGTVTESNTGTQSNSGTNESSERGSNDTTGEKTRNYTKTGNIGNISTQKLLNEELELWKYNFVNEMMRDVINFISLPLY